MYCVLYALCVLQNVILHNVVLYDVMLLYIRSCRIISYNTMLYHSIVYHMHYVYIYIYIYIHIHIDIHILLELKISTSVFKCYVVELSTCLRNLLECVEYLLRVRPISLLTLSLLTLLDSNFPGNLLCTREFHPFKSRLCWSQTL